MGSIHNDLATWAARTRAMGWNTMSISVDIAEKVSETIVEQANRIADLENELRELKNKKRAVYGINCRTSYGWAEAVTLPNGGVYIGTDLEEAKMIARQMAMVYGAEYDVIEIASV